MQTMGSKAGKARHRATRWRNQDTGLGLWQTGLQPLLCFSGHLASQLPPLWNGIDNCTCSRELLEGSRCVGKAEPSAWLWATRSSCTWALIPRKRQTFWAV